MYTMPHTLQLNIYSETPHEGAILVIQDAYIDSETPHEGAIFAIQDAFT